MDAKRIEGRTLQTREQCEARGGWGKAATVPWPAQSQMSLVQVASSHPLGAGWGVCVLHVPAGGLLHLNPISALQNLCAEFPGSFTPFPDDTEAQRGEAVYSMQGIEKCGREPGETCQWAARVVLAPTRG